MTGLVLLADPPNQTHLRLCLELSGGEFDQLWYWDRRGLGSVRLLSPEEFDERLGPDRIGPDALSISADELRDRLRHSRREIKPALLDQRAVAGVGNLYASELLHLAGVHPQRRCDRLTRTQWQRIHECMLDVLNEAIRHEGSTLSDGTYRNALNEAGGYQNLHRVYARENDVCPTCAKATIRRIVQTQRATFFCPSCQRKQRS
jgi:formamidopyrimidine-DNA glycosylase